jgi:hypothetical protein
MIIVNTIGGLGNQMFQYACGRAVSLRTRQILRIATDQFDGYALHNGFELHRVFHVETQQATEDEMKHQLGWRAHPTLRRLLGRPAMLWARGRHWCNEPYFQYWPGIKDILGPIYLHGYWQSERYFKDVADQIREDFNFRLPWDAADQNIREQMRALPSASLHIRRGDYALPRNRGIYAQCGIDYYRDAINLIRKRIPGIRLFAFSDDPDWVDAQLGSEFGPIETVRHNGNERSANDMRLMSQADHHIIANSSFSWWGAWLNPSPDKIVIAPRRWFLNNTDDHDLIPPSWIRI